MDNKTTTQSNLQSLRQRAGSLRLSKQNVFFKKAPLKAETADLFARVVAVSAEGNSEVAWTDVFGLVLDGFLNARDRQALAKLPAEKVEEAKARIFSFGKTPGRAGSAAE